MSAKNVTLNDPQKYVKKVNITETLIDGAIEIALKKLYHDLPRLKDKFTPPETINYIYEERKNTEWTSGMNTGIYWLAYELSGDKCFYNAAKEQVKTYYERYETKKGLLGHDVGFVFTPSCVADYKITGDKEAKELALKAAELLSERFEESNGYIRRSSLDYYEAYRTLVDTMMNIPLLMWACKESGNEKYKEMAIRHYNTTAKHLVREDGSTFHHFQFDPETNEPVRGVTLQGFSDDSCWSRGHSWLVYGYPIAYSYTKDNDIFSVHKAVTYYFLNNLPSDYIPYWDLVFGEGSKQPLDSSAAAISVCGLLEMCKHLNNDNPDKEIFKNAADSMMFFLIRKCTNLNLSRDGILTHVTHALPQNRGIDESAVYGDYFYLEALMRYKNPDWKMYW